MSLLEVVDTMNRLSGIHYRILKLMERSMKRFEYVPLQFIAKKIRLKPAKVEQIMNYLLKFRLIKRKTTEYIGYALTYKGLDAIALRALGVHGIISKVGPKIGMGKEGDIWIAYLNNKPRIIKLFRISKESFRQIRFHRYYYVGNRRMNWFELSFKSAYREFNALALLYRNGVHVPNPIARNRHVIVMEYVDGRELIKCRLEEPLEVFTRILNEISKAYNAGIVHADLSEFNVLVTVEGEIYIIDWPQYIRSDHPDAPKFLIRDIQQIVKYFNRRYKIPIKQLMEIVNEKFPKII